ncbi:MAG: O-antigen ligase family protein [Gammaproteobacteria bacterium]|nr:O-antigen ligase family protein [Gammaproteobacteria bacterium]
MIFFVKFLPVERDLSSCEKYLMLIVCFLVLTVLANYYFVDSSDFNYSRVRRYSRIFPVIAIIYVVARTKPREACLWYGVVIAAILSGILGISEWLNAPGMHLRLQGNTNPLVFGWLNSCLGLMAISSWRYFKEKNIWIRFLPFIGFALALFDNILSGSRSAWIAMLISSALLAKFHRQHSKTVTKYATTIVIILTCVVLYLIPQTMVKTRLNEVHQDVVSYVNNGIISTSIGARFEMWTLALEIFSDHPILGAGANEFKIRVDERIQSGRYPEVYHNFSEPHNEYIAALSSRGVLGLVSILLLFGLPLICFYRHTQSKCLRVRRIAHAGTVLVLSYAILGLTASVLDIWLSLSFFSFYLAVLMAYLYNQISSETIKMQ